MRTDLASFILSGSNAFDSIVEAFKLTPGLRLSDAQLCYGTQSGDVFITALNKNDQQQFVLVAKTPELQKWQEYMQAQGFALIQGAAA